MRVAVPVKPHSRMLKVHFHILFPFHRVGSFLSLREPFKSNVTVLSLWALPNQAAGVCEPGESFPSCSHSVTCGFVLSPLAVDGISGGWDRALLRGTPLPALPRPTGTNILGPISGKNHPGWGAVMAQSLPPTELFLLPCVCESVNLGQSQPPHNDFPTPGAPVSENVPECFPAAPDSPRGGESLFSCFLLFSVLLSF